jgi:hypothetical protein
MPDPQDAIINNEKEEDNGIKVCLERESESWVDKLHRQISSHLSLPLPSQPKNCSQIMRSSRW